MSILRFEGLQDTFSRRTLSNFFTIARFGPDTLVVFSLLSVLGAGLYFWGMWYMAVAVVLTIGLIFLAESSEMISLSRAEYPQILGSRCLVLKRATKESRGIVRLYDSRGHLEHELWSTEFSDSSVSEGAVAKVIGMKSVILEIATS
jgi:hypothetical protein